MVKLRVYALVSKSKALETNTRSKKVGNKKEAKIKENIFFSKPWKRPLIFFLTPPPNLRPSPNIA
jgi:hypothetical protein